MGLSDMLGSCELRFLRLHDRRFECGHHGPVLQAAAAFQLYHPRSQDSPAQTDPIMKNSLATAQLLPPAQMPSCSFKPFNSNITSAQTHTASSSEELCTGVGNFDPELCAAAYCLSFMSAKSTVYRGIKFWQSSI